MILITGIPRSRTSLTAAMLAECGACFGPPSMRKGPHRDNKLGFWEHLGIREQLQRPYFRHIECDPLGRGKLPTAADIVINADWRQRVERVAPGITAHKECKLLLYWEQWAAAYPKAKWVVVRRDRDEILESVSKRTSFMRGRMDKAEWQRWIDYHLERMDRLKQNVDYWEVETGRIMRGDFDQIKGAIKWCGLAWNSQSEHLIDPTVTYQRTI